MERRCTNDEVRSKKTRAEIGFLGNAAVLWICPTLVAVCLCWPLATKADSIPDLCASTSCLFIRSEPSLYEEASQLTDLLTLRLCPLGVEIIFADKLSSPPHEADPNSPPPAAEYRAQCPHSAKHSAGGTWWAIHLSSAGEGEISVAIDFLGAASDGPQVRSFPVGPDPRSTAWTIALLIEKIVAPYFRQNDAPSPIGAGLAIIEPPAVTGVAKSKQHGTQAIPSLRALSLGLQFTLLKDFLAMGPYAFFEVFISTRALVSIGAGWRGTGTNYLQQSNSATPVQVTLDQVPIDFLLGYILASRPRFGVTIQGGFSLGFARYKFATKEPMFRKTYRFPEPGVQARVEGSLNLVGPLSLYLNVSVDVPFFNDRFAEQRSGAMVLRQQPIYPSIQAGFMFRKVGNDPFF